MAEEIRLAISAYNQAVREVDFTWKGVGTNYVLASPRFLYSAWMATAGLVAHVASLVLYSLPATLCLKAAYSQEALEGRQSPFAARVSVLNMLGEHVVILIKSLFGTIFPWVAHFDRADALKDHQEIALLQIVQKETLKKYDSIEKKHELICVDLENKTTLWRLRQNLAEKKATWTTFEKESRKSDKTHDAELNYKISLEQFMTFAEDGIELSKKEAKVKVRMVTKQTSEADLLNMNSGDGGDGSDEKIDPS